MVTTTVEGRERFGVVVRYPRDARSDPEPSPARCWCRWPGRWGGGHGAPRPTRQGSDHHRRPAIRTENALLSAYIYVDIRDRDIGSYVAEARRPCRKGEIHPRHLRAWSGQFEYMERAEAKLKVVVPVTLLIIFVLLYLNFRRITETLIVMLSVPFALVGGWLMWALGYNLSVAAAVGFIALAGVAAETGVVMLIYLTTPGRA